MLRLQNSNEYEKYSFQCEIIDEAQFIKNANTQAAKAVKEIQTGFRLALTGTPVENLKLGNIPICCTFLCIVYTI